MSNFMSNPAKNLSAKNIFQEYKAWFYSIIASLYFFYEIIQINMINSLSKGLISSFHLSSTELALLSSTYFYGSLLLLIPAGVLLDRYSVKAILIISFAISLIGTFIFAFSNNIYEIFIGRLIAGFSGGPFCLVSSLYISYSWFKNSKFPIIIGITIAVGTLGGIISQLPLAMVVAHLGWRAAVVLNTLCGLVILIFITITIKENQSCQKKSIIKSSSFIIKDVFKNYRNWIAGIAAGLLNLPIFILGALWGNYYLMTIHHVNYLTASFICMMIYVGLLIGSPFWGILSFKSKINIAPALIGAVICSLTTALIIFIPSSPFYLSLCFLIVGFTSAAQLLSYSIIAKFNNETTIGTAESLVTWLILASGGIAQPLSGFLINERVNDTINNLYFSSILICGLIASLTVSAILYYVLLLRNSN